MWVIASALLWSGCGSGGGSVEGNASSDTPVEDEGPSRSATPTAEDDQLSLDPLSLILRPDQIGPTWRQDENVSPDSWLCAQGAPTGGEVALAGFSEVLASGETGLIVQQVVLSFPDAETAGQFLSFTAGNLVDCDVGTGTLAIEGAVFPGSGGSVETSTQRVSIPGEHREAHRATAELYVDGTYFGGFYYDYVFAQIDAFVVGLQAFTTVIEGITAPASNLEVLVRLLDILSQ